MTPSARGLTGTGSRNGAADEGLASNPDVKQILNRNTTEVILEGNEVGSKLNSIENAPDQSPVRTPPLSDVKG